VISTLLAFVFTLGVLIVIHEYGHYRVAVACGVKVLRFSVGFGRVLWRRQRHPGATEFVVCALPLGGYVRMLDEREGLVDPSELGRSFNRKPLWQRAAVVAAGPAANLLLAVLLYAGASWIGTQEARPVLSAPAAGSLAEAAGLQAGDVVRAYSDDGSDWIDLRSMADLHWQLTQAALAQRPLHLMLSARGSDAMRETVLPLQALPGGDLDAEQLRRIGIGAPYSAPVMGEVQAGGPAAAAGLQQGDVVLAVDGRTVADAQDLRERIRASVHDGQAQTMQWQLDRHGRTLTLAVTPRVLADGERPVGRVDAYVGGAPETVLVRRGPIDGLTQGLRQTWDVSALTLRMIGRMLIGEASVKNLSGPLTIADYAGQSVQQGPVVFLGFLALVSVSLGVLNLLPLPMLDGGHLMYYLFEGVTGRPVSDLWLARLQKGGLALLLMLMSLALFNDVARLLGLH